VVEASCVYKGALVRRQPSQLVPFEEWQHGLECRSSCGTCTELDLELVPHLSMSFLPAL